MYTRYWSSRAQDFFLHLKSHKINYSSTHLSIQLRIIHTQYCQSTSSLNSKRYQRWSSCQIPWDKWKDIEKNKVDFWRIKEKLNCRRVSKNTVTGGDYAEGSNSSHKSDIYEREWCSFKINLLVQNNEQSSWFAKIRTPK